MPSGLLLWVMSTITSPLDTTRSLVPSAMIAATPPSDAPDQHRRPAELVGDADRVVASRR